MVLPRWCSPEPLSLPWGPLWLKPFAGARVATEAAGSPPPPCPALPGAPGPSPWAQGPGCLHSAGVAAATRALAARTVTFKNSAPCPAPARLQQRPQLAEASRHPAGRQPGAGSQVSRLRLRANWGRPTNKELGTLGRFRPVYTCCSYLF